MPQSGNAKIGIVALILIIVVIVIFIGYQVFRSKKEDNTQENYVDSSNNFPNVINNNEETVDTTLTKRFSRKSTVVNWLDKEVNVGSSGELVTLQPGGTAQLNSGSWFYTLNNRDFRTQTGYNQRLVITKDGFKVLSKETIDIHNKSYRPAQLLLFLGGSVKRFGTIDASGKRRVPYSQNMAYQINDENGKFVSNIHIDSIIPPDNLIIDISLQITRNAVNFVNRHTQTASIKADDGTPIQYLEKIRPNKRITINNNAISGMHLQVHIGGQQFGDLIKIAENSNSVVINKSGVSVFQYQGPTDTVPPDTLDNNENTENFKHIYNNFHHYHPF